MDNIYVLIFYSVIAVFVLVTFFLVVYIKNQNIIWQQRKLFQETEIAQQKELLSAVIESQEKERKRIGEDLHDEIGGTLSAIKLMIGSLKKQDEAVQQVVVPTKELIDKMIVDVRNISHDLSPPGLAMFGLIHALESFIAIINNSGELEINIIENASLVSIGLTEREELALFRVLTQLINNTLKHASASTVTIEINVIEKKLQIIYTDNGKGFDLEILQERKGIGMQNIMSRLQMINASYKMVTQPNEGFKMEVELNR